MCNKFDLGQNHNSILIRINADLFKPWWDYYTTVTGYLSISCLNGIQFFYCLEKLNREQSNTNVGSNGWDHVWMSTYMFGMIMSVVQYVSTSEGKDLLLSDILYKWFSQKIIVLYKFVIAQLIWKPPLWLRFIYSTDKFIFRINLVFQLNCLNLKMISSIIGECN